MSIVDKKKATKLSLLDNEWLSDRKPISYTISGDGVADAVMKNMRFVPTSFTITGINTNPEAQGYLVPITKEKKKEKEIPAMTLPEISSIYYNMDKKVTTIVWKDQTSTVVHLGEGETFDRYTGFCACVMKKLFGSTSAAKKIMNAYDHDLILKKKAEEKAARRWEQEQSAQEAHGRRMTKLVNACYDYIAAMAIARKAWDKKNAPDQHNETETEPVKEQESTQPVS